jgi:hypothetical protein
MIMIDIDELRKLEQEAMPRPWLHGHDFRDDGADQVIADGLTICFMATPIEYHEADTELIVALRNAAPELLDELEQARERIKELEVENAEQKNALMELAEIIMNAKLKMGRLEKFADIIFASDEVFEK